MSEVDWMKLSIADCLATSFTGEWGTDPTPGNATVLRSTDIDSDGHVVGAGADRLIPGAKLRAKQLQDGDILLEGSGGSPDKPVGRVALFEAKDHVGSAICSNFFKTLRPKRAVVHDRFLWRKLGWFYNQPALLSLQQQTTGIINLKFAEYLESQIEVPADLLEQEKIADTLDALDSCIRQTESIIEKRKQIKEGLLHDLLTRGIDTNGELRPQHDRAPRLYEQSTLGVRPLAWSVDLLDQVAERGSGHTPSKSVASYWNGGVKWVSLADSHRLDQIYIAETDKEISDLGIANSSAVKHPAGAVILSRDAGVGKSAVLAGEMAVSQHFLAWHCGPRLNNLYLYFTFQRMKRHLEGIAIGSTVKTVGLDFFRKLRVFVPSREEQDQAVRILMAAEANVSDEERGLAKLQMLKRGLMDDLLTGSVRVTRLLDAATA